MYEVFIRCRTRAHFLRGFPPSVPISASADGLEVLKRVAQHYRDAKSYHIQSVEEQTHQSEFDHSWQKSILTAAVAPGNRYHYEVRSFQGGALPVSDSKNVWTYHVDDNPYTQKAISEQPAGSKSPQMTEYPLASAERLREEYGDLAKRLKSATRIGDANLTSNRPRDLLFWGSRSERRHDARKSRVFLRENALDRESARNDYQNRGTCSDSSSGPAVRDACQRRSR